MTTKLKILVRAAEENEEVPFIWFLLFLHLFSTLSPYTESKHQGTVPQQSSWDCGPAAAATILELAEITPLPWPSEIRSQTISLAELADYLKCHDLDTVGYKLDWGQLQYFWDRFPHRPLLAHLSLEKGHFVVLLGLLAEGVVLANPSEGIQVLAPALFLRDFSGYILHFPQLPELISVQKLLFSVEQRLRLLHNATIF